MHLRPWGSQLPFVAYTLKQKSSSQRHLRQQLSSPSDLSQPKQVPLAERNARMTQVKARLNGVTIEGANEPAHQLIDECVFQYETRQLRYVEPGKCHSREVEISSGRANKKLKLDNNTLSVKETRTIPEESITTAFQLSQCFKRRAVGVWFRRSDHLQRAWKVYGCTHAASYHWTSSRVHANIYGPDSPCWQRSVQPFGPKRSWPKAYSWWSKTFGHSIDDRTAGLQNKFPPDAIAKEFSRRIGTRARLLDKMQEEIQKERAKARKERAKGPSLHRRDSQTVLVAIQKEDHCVSIVNLGRCNQAAVGSACSRGRHMCFKANCFKPHAYIDEHKTEPKEWQSEQKPQKFSREGVVILELFCGTAGLTAAFKRLNFSSSVAVDKSQPQVFACKCRSFRLDKFRTSSLSFRLDSAWPHNCSIHGATVRHVQSCTKHSNWKWAFLLTRPLRSMDEPDGLQGLSDHERLRVSQANILYHFCQQVFDLCTQLNKPCMVENPLHSLFWMTTAWKEITHVDSLVYQAHQACAYGAKRPKWTLLAANFRQVTMINRICDNQHPHEPWGKVVSNGRQVFATSLEVHYPQKLCDAIAEAFLARLQQQYNFADSPFPRNVDFKACNFSATSWIQNTRFVLTLPHQILGLDRFFQSRMLANIKSRLVWCNNSFMSLYWGWKCMKEQTLNTCQICTAKSFRLPVTQELMST